MTKAPFTDRSMTGGVLKVWATIRRGPARLPRGEFFVSWEK
jgi:hypothetical protein